MMPLYESLYQSDLWLFRHCNGSWTSIVADAAFPFITNNTNILPVYVLLLVLAVWKGGREGRLMVGILILTIILLDQSIILLKEYVGRLRPCQTLVGVRLLVSCGTGQSFPSAHAANNFAAAIVAILFYPAMRWWFMLWAFLVAYSRVYCGVHYPSDILGGSLLGIIVGYSILVLWHVMFSKHPHVRLPSPPLGWA